MCGEAGGSAKMARWRSICAVALMPLAVWIYASCAYGASMLSVGQDEGYSAKVMSKIVDKWRPPSQIKGAFRLNIQIMVDGNGKLLDCRVQNPSGFEPLDVSACAAVRAAAPFSTPPYGQPADLYFTFWTGNPAKQSSDTLAAYGSDGKDARTRARENAERAARESGRAIPAIAASSAAGGSGSAALERARSRAEAAAKATGKKLPERPQKSETPKVQEKAPREPVQTAQAPKLEHEPVQVSQSPVQAPGGVKPAQTAPRTTKEKYISSVEWKLRNAMYVPKEVPPGSYHAQVRLTCDKNGKILSYSIAKGSGSDIVDKYVLQGIKRAGRIKPPPPEVGKDMDLDFTLVRAGKQIAEIPAPEPQPVQERQIQAEPQPEPLPKSVEKPKPAELVVTGSAVAEFANARKQAQSGHAAAPISESPPAPVKIAEPPAKSRPAPRAPRSVKEKYISTVEWKLRNAMYVPAQAPPGTYHAQVRLTCDKSGKILSYAITQGSGSGIVDKYVLQGIERAGRIKPPPPELGDTFDLNFTLIRK